MCNRFTQMYSWEELYNLCNLSNPHTPNIRPNWNVAPTEDIGVVVPEEGGIASSRCGRRMIMFSTLRFFI